MALTPAEFVARWSDSTRNEIQSYQSHFYDLCQIIGFDPRSDTVDKSESPVLFEENVPKTEGGVGRADVYRPKYFACEYKAKGKDLDLAHSQLQSYAPGLNNPPLLIVCNFDEFRIYPQWPNIDRRPWVFHNADLVRQDIRDLVYAAINDPKRLQRMREDEAAKREQVTVDLAKDFAKLASMLRDPKEGGDPSLEPLQVARFLTKIIFAMFAEDVGLLPKINGVPVLEYIFQTARADPASFKQGITDLFKGMSGEKDRVFMQPVAYFNGGLFEPPADDVVIDLTANANARNLLHDVNASDWRSVSPSIFGTVFERALDPSKRKQLGAHYTSESDILLVIDPVLMQPLNRKWERIVAETGALWPELEKSPAEAVTARAKLQTLYYDMLNTLATTTVLDPACGSGNFLYMSLRAMKALEDEVHKHFKPLRDALNLPRRDVVTPLQLYGIEVNTFAAELARVVVWIGYLQWRFTRDGYLKPKLPGRPADADTLPEPIIASDGKQHIINDDAILRFDADGSPYEPEWPSTTVIVGNPPFLGSQGLRGELGDEYTEHLRSKYRGRLAGVDLVCYWFERAREQIEGARTSRVGLIATNSIRGGTNRSVLTRIQDTGRIFAAWSDNEWVLDGAAVRISIVAFDDGSEQEIHLDGVRVAAINPDLTSLLDLTVSKSLSENRSLAFQGVIKTGAFDIDSVTAAKMIASPNVTGKTNADVVRQIINAAEITGREPQRWIVDFNELPLQEASAYEAPFRYVEQNVRSSRQGLRERGGAERWWIMQRPRPEMRRALQGLERFVLTPRVSKHRLFVLVHGDMLPSDATVAFARDDDYFFGVLHSYIHEIWSLRLGTWLGKGNDPRYTPTTTFETFPFPYPPGHEPGRPASLYAETSPPGPLSRGEGEQNAPDSEAPLLGRGVWGEVASEAGGEGAVRAIATLAAALHAERDAWLNPPGVTDAKVLKSLTLTNLYNALADHRAGKTLSRELFPFNGVRFVSRLRELHDQLDAAVLRAYGWDDLIGRLRTSDGDEELLSRLLAENLRRAAK